MPSTVTWYEISASGIDKIEGESEFQQNSRWSGININATSSIVTLGDGNVVHASHAKLHQHLDELKQAIGKSTSLDDDSKLSVTADIETLKDQLVKEKPDPSVVHTLWAGIQKFVTGAEFVDYAARIAPIVETLAN